MDSFQIQPQNQGQGRVFGPPVQPYLPPRQRKTGMIIALACVCAGIFVCACAGWFVHTQSAAYKIKKGLLNLAKEAEELQNPLSEKLGMDEINRMFLTEGGQVDTRLNFTFDSFLGEATLGVDTDYAVDREAKEMSSSTTVSMMNYDLAHVELYGDEEVLCFSIPELFLEDMYLENENVLSQYNRSMWADDMLLGKAQGDDFSIELFPDMPFSAEEEGGVNAFLDRYAREIENCRRNMRMEKAGKDLYRVSFDQGDFNELVRQMLFDYMELVPLGREEAVGILSCFDVNAVGDEISFVFEISAGNRIESIRMEKPLSLSEGRLSLDGEIYFLGGERSLEKLQGKISIDRDRRERAQEAEIRWQVVQSLERDNYRMETDLRCSFLDEGESENMGFSSELFCDERRNSFEATMTARLPEQEVGLEAEGAFSDIEEGESFDLELDELLLLVDEDEILKITGDVALEPLTRRVKQNVKPRTPFFELTERDWEGIAEELDRAYGYLWDAIPELLW